MSQAITYPDIPGVKWVYNRSNKPAEVQWNSQIIEIPAHVVMPLPDLHARQAIVKGTYRHYGASNAETYLVINGMEGFNVPLSAEEQAYLDGDDPITHSTIDMRPENDVIYGPPSKIKVQPDGLPTHGPQIAQDMKVAAIVKA